MGDRFRDRLADRDYLGDGVYAGRDGHDIVLWLDGPGHFGSNAICLDPEVLEALDRYRKRTAPDPGESA